MQISKVIHDRNRVVCDLQQQTNVGKTMPVSTIFIGGINPSTNDTCPAGAERRMFEALGTKGLEDTDGGMKMGPKE